MATPTRGPFPSRVATESMFTKRKEVHAVLFTFGTELARIGGYGGIRPLWQAFGGAQDSSALRDCSVITLLGGDAKDLGSDTLCPNIK